MGRYHFGDHKLYEREKVEWMPESCVEPVERLSDERKWKETLSCVHEQNRRFLSLINLEPDTDRSDFVNWVRASSIPSRWRGDTDRQYEGVVQRTADRIPPPCGGGRARTADRTEVLRRTFPECFVITDRRRRAVCAASIYILLYEHIRMFASLKLNAFLTGLESCRVTQAA